MSKTEIPALTGESAPLVQEVKQAMAGFVHEFKGLKAEVKTKLQQTEERLTMLDRKSTIAARPHLAASIEDGTAKAEGNTDILAQIAGTLVTFQIVFFSSLFGFPLLTLLMIRDAKPGTLRPQRAAAGSARAGTGYIERYRRCADQRSRKPPCRVRFTMVTFEGYAGERMINCPASRLVATHHRRSTGIPGRSDYSRTTAILASPEIT